MNFKFKPKRFVSLVTIFALVIGVSVFAEPGSEDVNSVIEEQSLNNDRLISVEERIALLESQKGDNEAYLEELNNQLNELTENLNYVKQQYDDKISELTIVKSDLDQMQKSADEQYENMKLRIQFMYETGVSSSGIVSFLSAENFVEALNRAENYSAINRYDREMLQEYTDTISAIKDKEASLNEETEQLFNLKIELEDSTMQVQELYAATYNSMQECLKGLDQASSEQSMLASLIANAEDTINALLAEQYKEEAQIKIEEAQTPHVDNLGNTYEEYVPPVYIEPSVEEVSGAPPVEEPVITEPQAPEVSIEEPSVPEVEYTPVEQAMTYLGNFTLTAYCACSICCGSWASGYTASGTWATQGVTCAMGGVPFGTQLSIDGHIYTVEDRGTAYGHVDIFFDSHDAALAFGLRYADVYQLN